MLADAGRFLVKETPEFFDKIKAGAFTLKVPRGPIEVVHNREVKIAARQF